MRNILIPHAGGLVDYKGEDLSLFIYVANVDGGIHAEYFGESDAWADYVNPNPDINVVIESISGTGYIGGDTSLFDAKELSPISIAAIIDKPDGVQLVLPMKREDTGRIITKFAQVSNGKVVFNFAFPTSGIWECTEELINTMARGGDKFLFSGIVAVVDMT